MFNHITKNTAKVYVMKQTCVIPRGDTLIFSYIRKHGLFLGGQSKNKKYFLEIFWCKDHCVDILGVISMHNSVFS